MKKEKKTPSDIQELTPDQEDALLDVIWDEDIEEEIADKVKKLGLPDQAVANFINSILFPPKE